MHKNPAWFIFLALIALCIAGYTGLAGYKLFRYVVHSTAVEVDGIQWKALLREGSFFVSATSYYTYQGKVFEGSSELPEKHLNRWAAEKKIAELQKQSWKAWIDPRHPSDSTLQKNFPLKECISTVILWGILLYFLWLGFYVAKKYGTNHT